MIYDDEARLVLFVMYGVVLMVIGIVIGYSSYKVKSSKKIDESNDIILSLSPWRKYVGEHNLDSNEHRKCDMIVEKFGRLNFMTPKMHDIVDSIMYTIDDCLSYPSPSAFRQLAHAYNGVWECWRYDKVYPVSNPDLYLLASLLELFVIQSAKSSMTMSQKVKLSRDISENVCRFSEDVGDILLILKVALDCDDLIFDFDSKNNEFVNYDCIMWGCKKVMELIHSDMEKRRNLLKSALNSKTRKCLSYNKRRNRRRD